jgi:cation:H+ antiporter
LPVDAAVDAWLQFVACAALIAIAGTRLSRYGDVIADKTGLSGAWIGLVLLATVTSLPELVVGASAVTVADVPDIAVGDVMGSCVFNLAILVVVELVAGGESIYRRTSQGQILAAAFGIVLIGFAGVNIVLGSHGVAFPLGHIGAYTPIIVALYVLGVRAVFVYERSGIAAYVEQSADRYPQFTLAQAVLRYAAAAIVVLAAGIWLPFAASSLARAMDWQTTFVGTLFVAGATSLPELTVSIASIRMGAVDMAVANLLGSNLFNILVLAVDDVLYRRGPLLAHVSPLHATSALSAMVMTGIVIVGVLYRPRRRLVDPIGWIGFGLLTVYLLNTYVLYLRGE